MRPVDYAALTEKRCAKCQANKPVSEFGKYDDPTAKITGWRYYSWCRECSNKRAREYGTKNRPRRNARLRRWRAENPEAAREKDRAARLARFGLDEEQADALLAVHDGLCWLCRARPATAKDHDHATGAFRGMLCTGCNSVTVARADADPDYLTRVAAYLSNDHDPFALIDPEGAAP